VGAVPFFLLSFSPSVHSLPPSRTAFSIPFSLLGGETQQQEFFPPRFFFPLTQFLVQDISPSFLVTQSFQSLVKSSPVDLVFLSPRIWPPLFIRLFPSFPDFRWYGAPSPPHPLFSFVCGSCSSGFSSSSPFSFLFSSRAGLIRSLLRSLSFFSRFPPLCACTLRVVSGPL